ncbi:hypothetical protein C7476_115134 [Phyllobacterium bourgognense]|uniref:Uncharacterized protein n=1 Tax=Phyllobacterium bourgognense TaxID=314236 RepID=A0A368YKM7_9HYPH|nr:hypothetical protein C7476_115134 [Phyllobacterium bourgognense]
MTTRILPSLLVMMRTSLKGFSSISAKREALGLGSVMRSSQILLGTAAQGPETAHHRIRRRTIKNTQTVTMTAMAAKGYIRKLGVRRFPERDVGTGPLPKSATLPDAI